MTARKMIALALLLALLALAGAAAAQEPDGEEPDALLANVGTTFTYQGRLVDAGNPADGVYDFQFRLYDAAGGGAQIGSTDLVDDVGVSDGLFTVTLDFGVGAFDGQARWLEIDVKRDVDAGYTTLSPRVALTAAPNALALPGLWTQQNATSPNLIGGYAGNVMGAGVQGSLIGGGGSGFYVNAVYDNYGTLGGGLSNLAGNNDGDPTNQEYATVAGGSSNTASGRYAVVGGGYNNTGSGSSATVAGGLGNDAAAVYATVGGGWNNSATVGYATIGGGGSNTASGGSAAIGGGFDNTASGAVSSVGGGANNQALADYATIAGGGPSDTANPTTTNNRAHDVYGTIGGGGGNVVGLDDGNPENQEYATVSGGNDNIASNYRATVGGGGSNIANGGHATVSGGSNNTASGNSSTVSGGYGNSAGPGAAIGGGSGNIASGTHATVPGGVLAAAEHYGEFAYSSGPFAGAGDAQTSLYVLRQQTIGAGQRELFLDGSTERITLADDRVMTFDMLIVATHRFGGGSSAGYQVTGVIRNIGGVTAFVGTPVKTVLGENVASWDVSVEANDTLDALRIMAQGSADTTVRWVASVRTVEVGR